MEKEARLAERENRILAKEKWATELHEREKLIHERERIVHEREQRLERLLREHEDRMDVEMEKNDLGNSLHIKSNYSVFRFSSTTTSSGEQVSDAL